MFDNCRSSPQQFVNFRLSLTILDNKTKNLFTYKMNYFQVFISLNSKKLTCDKLFFLMSEKYLEFRRKTFKFSASFTNINADWMNHNK